MQRITWVWILFALWAGLYAASFIVAHHTAPTGDSFLRGMNRLMVFFQFQIAAGIVAIVLWGMGRVFNKGTWRRWLSRIPVLLAVGLVLLIVGLIVYANLGRPAPDASYVPPKQATEPAKAVIAE
ncbi:hypothetical protein [Roseovarius pelagicus]|uniref:Uncharacterized protein n=1 Tax=Roseovarius pelagicus TaxID=2980108 RepID=A0ABY6DDE6_9RHOB|nr:hypothetical protein [Roseovarius pelagicus]UXX84177.1 hypothetical protein N7U68_05865 [Roseovarius pelagicus]